MFSIAWLNGATVHLNINSNLDLRTSTFALRNSEFSNGYR